MDKKTVHIPNNCLVLMAGAPLSGKTSFASKYFEENEILCLDKILPMSSNGSGGGFNVKDAWSIINHIVDIRLRNGRLTVIDDHNMTNEFRIRLADLAKKHHINVVVFAIDTPMGQCIQRNKSNRRYNPKYISDQYVKFKKLISRLRKFHKVENVYPLDEFEIVRDKINCDYREIEGPFAIVGDIHGCYDELVELIDKIDDRQLVFVGDMVDRGPDSIGVIRLISQLVKDGKAYLCPGNHDKKFYRYLQGSRVQQTNGLDGTVAAYEALPEEEKESFKSDFIELFDSLPSHYMFDHGKLVVCHGGLPQEYHGRDSRKVSEIAMYGVVDKEAQRRGELVRIDWAADYRGRSLVVYGHTPQEKPRWRNNTVNIDTGCVFGGNLTAMKYPELEMVSVSAKKVYYESEGFDQSFTKNDKVIDVEDIMGYRVLNTGTIGPVTIDGKSSASAFETMVLNCVDERLLPYLPPTMSPSDSSSIPGFLEHPNEAFEYFRCHGVNTVVCQEKHMGSRATALIFKTPEDAEKRIGVSTLGTVYSRTGRPFFDGEKQVEFVNSLHKSMTEANVWEEYNTNWILLDGELMPWSAKAFGLLRNTYSSTAISGKMVSKSIVETLEKAANRIDSEELNGDIIKWSNRQGQLDKFHKTYHHYCWDVGSTEDLKFAPFAVLATERKAHFDKSNIEQMSMIQKMCNGIIVPTKHLVVDLNNEEDVAKATEWWLEMTESGGEGMVVKPEFPISPDGSVTYQPGVKCRGREYLRLIYGPEYTEHLQSLRNRGTDRKRSAAIREFALGIESVTRMVNEEPIRRINECVFGVLALESNDIDPRL